MQLLDQEDLKVLLNRYKKGEYITNFIHKDKLNDVLLAAHSLVLLSPIDSRTLPHSLGLIGGTVIDKLGPRPQASESNLEFLAQLGSRIPIYFEQFNQLIQKATEKMRRIGRTPDQPLEPLMTEAELADLELASWNVLDAIKHASSSSLMATQAVAYYRQLEDITLLVKRIIKSTTQVTASTSTVIKGHLKHLKLDLLPGLLSIADKLEEQAMLEPGYISASWLTTITWLYELVTYYTSYVVSFEDDKSLLILNDSAFIAARSAPVFKRMAVNSIRESRWQLANDAMTAFFAELPSERMPEDRLIAPVNTWLDVFRLFITSIAPSTLPGGTGTRQRPDVRLKDLPNRDLLEQCFKVFEPYLTECDMAARDGIAAGFLKRLKEEELELIELYFPLDVKNTDWVSNVRDLERPLRKHLDRDMRSRHFSRLLQNDLLDYITLQADKLILFPFPLGISPTVMNEEVILSLERGLDYSGAGEHRFVSSLQELTTAEVIRLYQAYVVRYQMIQRSKRAWDVFFSEIILGDFTWEKTLRLRNLYAVFQPYWVTSGIEGAAVLDRSIVPFLSTVWPQPLVKIEDSLGICERFQEVLDSGEEALHTRLATIRDHAQRSLREEAIQKPLTLDSRGDRAHYVIKHKAYSKAIRDFRESLFPWLQICNASLNAHLHRAKKGLPFPELSDPLHVLTESSQALGIKRLFNWFYYLEMVEDSLEKLNDESTESLYAYHVLNVVLYAQSAVYLTYDLAATPYLAVLGAGFKDKLQGFLTMFYELLSRYVPWPIDETKTTCRLIKVTKRPTTFEEIEDRLGGEQSALFFYKNELYYAVKETRELRELPVADRNHALVARLRNHDEEADRVATAEEQCTIVTLTERSTTIKTWPQLFYSWNVLEILPEHVAGLRGDGIPKEKLRALHAHSEKVSTEIARLVSQSSSTIRLLSEKAAIYKVYEEIKTKLKRLASASYETVGDKLKEINEVDFTRLLLAVDEWEDSMSLRPGWLSGPLKNILDTFYQGLLVPFELPSAQHIALALSPEPMKKRRAAALARHGGAVQALTDLKEKKGRLDALQQAIVEYESVIELKEPTLLSAGKMDIKRCYRRALTILQELPATVVSPAEWEAMTALLDSSSKEWLTALKTLVNKSTHAFTGMEASLELTKAGAEEKKKYLRGVDIAQWFNKGPFIKKYTEDYFDKYMQAHTDFFIDLVYCQEDYKEALAASIQRVKPFIFISVNKKEMIEVRVNRLLRNTILKFKAEQDVSFKALDEVMGQLNQFSQYLTNSRRTGVVHESKNTLKDKDQLLKEMRGIITNKRHSVQERLENFKTYVSSGLFKRRINQSALSDSSTTWLAQVITPATHKGHHEQFTSLAKRSTSGLFKPPSPPGATGASATPSDRRSLGSGGSGGSGGSST